MSKIEWTDETWNPVSGCSMISEGCQNCYAKRRANLLKGRFGYPADDGFKPGNWRGDYVAPSKGYPVIEQPLHWRKPRRVFVCSMADLFHKDVTWKARQTTIYMIRRCPQHTFILLTKRPYAMGEFFSLYPAIGVIPNLWLGITAENQERFNQRWPILSQIPAAVRFVSVEPMLTPVIVVDHRTLPDWVICGSESGQHMRVCRQSWIEQLKNQCVMAKIPFFLKQSQLMQPSTGKMKIEKMPELGGRVWDQVPKGSK